MEDRINIIEKRPELLTAADLEGKKVRNRSYVHTGALEVG